jgi:hypothetical protein
MLYYLFSTAVLAVFGSILCCNIYLELVMGEREMGLPSYPNRKKGMPLAVDRERKKKKKTTETVNRTRQPDRPKQSTSNIP